jgi:hypothetical protein
MKRVYMVMSGMIVAVALTLMWGCNGTTDPKPFSVNVQGRRW